ncbi:MAG TPA: ribbon-helix-helix domain-containing protein [Methylovirgula sp.]
MLAADPPAQQRAATIVKRSLAIAGHRTSISLEDAFWDGLRQIADERKLSVAALVAEIDATRGANNLSSAIRVFVLKALAQI